MPTLTYGPPPATDLVVTPTAEDVAFFQENGYLVVDRITTDEELAWLRQIYEDVFDPANRDELGAPVERTDRALDPNPTALTQPGSTVM